jgi:hypothetical protein
MSMTGMRWIGKVCIGIVAALLVLPGVVRAAPVDDGWADGSTLATGSCLTTGAWISNKVYRSPLSLQSGDQVVSHFNASWSDTRHAPAAAAVHSFHLQSAWTVEETYHWDDWYNVTTYGDASGSTSLSVTTGEIYFEYNIVVTWVASVTTTACGTKSAQDQATIVIDLP